MASFHVRPARRSDLPDLTEIYNHCVINTAITFDIEPFTVEQRGKWFDEHADTGRYRLLVAEERGRVIGFAGAGPFRNKRAYETTVETTIYCAPGATGRGIGTAMYRELFDAIAQEDINRILAGITLPNDASIALHEHCGFRRAALFSENGRKFGRFWDVAWFERAARL
jgi:phosphinothricin acetyltransferase